MGRCTASRKAAASSGNPLSCLGLSTLTSDDGISTLRSPLRYCSCVSNVRNSLLISPTKASETSRTSPVDLRGIYPRAKASNPHSSSEEPRYIETPRSPRLSWKPTLP